MRRWPGILAAAVAACGGEPAPSARVDAGPAPGPVVLHLGDVADAAGEGRAEVDVDVTGRREVRIELDGAPRVLEVAYAFPSGEASLDGDASAGWFHPRAVTAASSTLELRGSGVAHVTVWARGAPVPAARRERSLVWIDPEVLDDPSLAGFGRVLAAASDDGHGGQLLDRWFRRFATTAHSERAGPAQLMDEIAGAQGANSSAWDTSALPFRATGVHNRLDLGPRDGGCGQLRVSFASTHPIYQPLHVLFLFRQEPFEDDIAPDGAVHCLGTARRWARLATVDGPAFVAASAAVLDRALTRAHFLLAETVELTVSPWEWRQWIRVGVDELDNPPLFQTIDVPGLDAPGPLRDDFLAFVGQNAAALADRTLEIPDTYRPRSARVPPSAPADPLDLAGVDPAVAKAYPDLGRAIEIVGCPKCHTENAEFVQTSADRKFSPFYDKELDARGTRLDGMNDGDDPPEPPFGPLQ